MTTFKAGACAAVLAAVAALAPAAQASRAVEAKRAEAARIARNLEASGERLSLANERYNDARVKRQSLDTQAATAHEAQKAAQERWVALRAQLSRRVRSLYMHPGAVADALLGVKSLSDLGRAKAYGSSVLTADTSLVMKTERARQNLLREAKRVDQLRAAAQANEENIAAQRSNINSNIRNLSAAKKRVNGQIATLLEIERQQELAAARRGPSGRPHLHENRVFGPPPPVSPNAGTALAAARAQMGKPYKWAADGPDSFDCSGLTMYAWGKAGVNLPHSSRAQYGSLPHVASANLQPGDLVFFGSPIHHVGIYEGGGMMINAPETGENVRRDSIGRSDFVGGARPG